MRRLLTILFSALAGILLAIVGQTAAQAAGGTVSGTVTDEQSGTPIPGVTVYLYTADYDYMGSAYTNQSGQFTISVLVSGDYKIQYNAPYGSSYLGEWYDNKADFDTANPVTVDSSNVTANAALAKGARITGKVTAEDTGDPIPGGNVYVYAKNNYYTAAYASIGQDGVYTTGAMPPGDYKIQYNAPYQSRYLSEWHNNKSSFYTADPVTVTTTDKTVNASLATGARLVGTVTNANGQPVSNVSIQVEGDDDYGWAYTDSNGEYASSALPAGEYKVRFRPSGTTYVEEWYNNKASWSEADPVTLNKGQDKTIDIGLDYASHIVGTVTDPQGNPVSAEVRAYANDNTYSDDTAIDGTYDIGGLRQGSYRLRITPTEPSPLIREWWNNQRDEFDADRITLGADDTFTADVALNAGATITGTVLDDQGIPAEGVIVRATGAESEKTLTAADGTYSLTGLEPGSYRVRFKPQADFALQWFDSAESEGDATLLTVLAGETVPDIDAQLRRSRTISGTVTDPQGNPVEDVRVEVYREGSSYYTDRDWTDALGTFQTSDLPVGNYRIYLRPSSPTAFASQWYDKSPTRGGATPIAVKDGQAAIVAAELEPGGSITGRVTGTGGVPLSDASVIAETGDDYRYATTDINGDYEITGLSAADYTVEFYAFTSGYVGEWYDNKDAPENADPVTVDLGQPTANINAQLAKAGSISGTVKTSDGDAVPYDYVVLYQGDEQVNWTSTNMNGTFSFNGLRPGTYTMRTYGTGEWLGQWWNNKPDQASADRIQVTAGQNLAGKDFTLQRGASIAGTVTGSGGTLVDGYVEITDSEGDELGWAEIDRGSYKVVGVRAGTYYAYFRSYDGDWMPQWWNNKPTLQQATPITVSNGQSLTGVNATLAKASSIKGTVLNGKGNPVSTCVTVYVGATDEEAGYDCTDGAGKYLVGALPAGNYQVRFDPYSGDYARQWWNGQARRGTASSILLGPGAQATADATVLKGGTLTGVVTDEGGNPVGGVQVRAFTQEYYYDAATVTDGQGRYTIMGLDDDDYRLQAAPGSSRLDLAAEWYDDKSSYADADAVPVPNGGNVTANFELEKGATISGTVTDDQDRPVAGIGVDVFDLDGKKSLTVWTDPDGKYTSTALKADTYKVRFMPGYYGGEGLVEQWWNDKPTEAKANFIFLGPKEQKTGVDAKLKPIGSATAPGTPTGVSATPGDEQVTIVWQAPANDGGLAITRYIVEGTTYGQCETLGELVCTIKGLDNGESYSFTVRALNSAGSSPASTPSNAAVPFGKPAPPTSVKATAGQESATVSWTPGSSNGRPILDYAVTASPGGKKCTTTGTQCTVSGLTGGTAYTFTVKARNIAGESAASQASAAVTPSSPPTPPPGGGTTPPAPVTPAPTPAAPTAPSAPAKLKVKVKKRKASTSWAKVADATAYEVRVSSAKGKKSGWKRTSKSSFTSGKLKKGKYTLEVRAVGAGGTSGIASKRFTVK